MGNKKLIACRLCLKRVEIRSSDYQLVDEIEREVLEVLRINIDLAITKQPIICNECMAQLQQCFDFKATCLYTEDFIFPFVDPDNGNKVELKKIFVNQIKVEDEKTVINKVCRFCMKQIDNEYFVTLDNTNENIFLKDVLRKHFPELDSTSIHDFVSCEICFESLRKAFDFINSCLDTEETVKLYQEINEESGTKPFDLAQIELYDRKEDIHNCVDLGIDSLDINDNKNGILQDLNYVEHVKSEIGWETTQMCEESFQEVNPSPHQISKQEKQPPQSTFIKNMKNDDSYECETCGFKTWYKSTIASHMLTHKDPSETIMYKCDICAFKTKYSGSLSHHKSLHSEAGKKHRCTVCSYKTTRATYLERHMIKHRNRADIQTYKCMECSFETKHKDSLRNHVVVHKDFGVYKCAQCNYQTKHRRCLTSHMAFHKDPPKDSAYKCKQCLFGAKTKSGFDRHMMIHRDL